MATPAAPLLPRDSRLIALLLAANGAEDADEGVVRMLTEFAHRYTSDILTDSLLYAEHARSGQPSATSTSSNAPTISMDDVRLAVQARTEGAGVSKEFLLSLSTPLNSIPLPSIPEVYGIRLPPPATRLTAPNFTLGKRTRGDDMEGDDDGGLFGDDDDEEEIAEEEGEVEGDGEAEGERDDLSEIAENHDEDEDQEEEEDEEQNDEDEEEDEEDEEMEEVNQGYASGTGTAQGEGEGSDEEYD